MFHRPLPFPVFRAIYAHPPRIIKIITLSGGPLLSIYLCNALMFVRNMCRIFFAIYVCVCVCNMLAPLCVLCFLLWIWTALRTHFNCLLLQISNRKIKFYNYHRGTSVGMLIMARSCCCCRCR